MAKDEDFRWEVGVKIKKQYMDMPKDTQEEILRQGESCKLEAYCYILSKRMKGEIIERFKKECTYQVTR